MGSSFESLPEEARQRLKKRTRPSWISPMLATLTQEQFSREGWIFGPKLDGERCLAFRYGGEVQLTSNSTLTYFLIKFLNIRTQTYNSVRWGTTKLT